ncbi:hypothetical protein, partial [Enterobacter cloacae]|uniref:hypothetical protein n=1 Tax=Enterobacter cloacae TaxID=550 RepID=UPI0039C07666
LAIDQIAQSGLSSLSVIYYSAQLFSLKYIKINSLALVRGLIDFFHPYSRDSDRKSTLPSPN